MQKWSIRDSAFSHVKSIGSNVESPTFFEWTRTDLCNNFIFLVDNHVFDIHNVPAHIKKYAWVHEPRVINPHVHDFIQQNNNLFNLIFTSAKDILDNCKNSYFVPAGGCYIDNKADQIIHKKHKLVSFTYSTKKNTEGHIFRHYVAECLKSVNHVTRLGTGSGHYIQNKIECYKDYKFAIVIENIKQDFLFTEKILECFLTGTVPIYWGCKSIGNFFNEDGIISFNTIEELTSVINNITFLEEFYQNKTDVIRENYNIAQNYKLAEDYMFNKYSALILEG